MLVNRNQDVPLSLLLQEGMIKIYRVFLGLIYLNAFDVLGAYCSSSNNYRFASFVPLHKALF